MIKILPLYESIIIERKDVYTLAEASKLLKEIDRKINEREFMFLPTSMASDNYLVVNIKEPELTIRFTDKRNSKYGGFFNREDDSIVIYNCFFNKIGNEGSLSENNLKLTYNKHSLTHELIHYIDKIKGYKSFGTMDLSNDEYNNAPSEFNAHFLSIVKPYYTVYYIKNLPDFNRFKNVVMNTSTEFGVGSPIKYFESLNPVYQKKFLSRLYDFYLKLNKLKEKYS